MSKSKFESEKNSMKSHRRKSKKKKAYSTENKFDMLNVISCLFKAQTKIWRTLAQIDFLIEDGNPLETEVRSSIHQ